MRIRIGVRFCDRRRAEAYLVGYRAQELRPSGGCKRRNRQEDRLAYLSQIPLDRAGQKGERVKVVQELLRHAHSSTTLDLYQQANVQAKRSAQGHVDGLFVLERRTA